MQYIVTGWDGDDEDALKRRMNAREAHLSSVEILKEKKQLKMAAALLSEDGKMIGSVMIVEFENEKELNEWLEIEPYLIQGVWLKKEIIPCKVAPGF